MCLSLGGPDPESSPANWSLSNGVHLDPFIDAVVQVGVKFQAVAVHRTNGCQDCRSEKIVSAQSCRENCVWRPQHEE